VRDVRRCHPEILLSVDANSAYTISDAEYLKQLDDFRLLMIEQPLDHDDLSRPRQVSIDDENGDLP
jgi:O-succinylbenzoate synthase